MQDQVRNISKLNLLQLASLVGIAAMAGIAALQIGQAIMNPTVS